MSRLNNLWIALIAYTVFILLLFPFIPFQAITFPALGLGYIFLTGIFRPRMGLFLFLLTRPALDYFTEQNVFSFASYEINLASLWGVAVLVLAIWTLYKNFHLLPRLPLLKPWMLFLLIVLITIPLSVSPALSIREFIRLLTIVSFFILGYMVITENKHFTDHIKIVVFSMLLPAGLAYYQFFTDAGLTLPLENIYNRIYGTFAHSNLFAVYLIIPLLLSLIIVLIKNKKEVATYGFGFLAAAFSILLVLTYTRGAWIAFLLAILIIGMFRYRKILVTVLAVFALLYLAVPTIQERTERIIHPDPYGSIIWRLDLWQDSIGYAQNNLLLGHGAGTAKEVILKNRGEFKGSPHPHNDYLKILLEYGIVGLLAYLYLLVSVLILLWKNYRYESRPNFKNLYLTLFALSAALFLMSFGDNMIRNTTLQWALWSLIGGALIVSPYVKRSSNS